MNINENYIEDFVLIPKERIGVLIGKKGSTKKKIEEMFGVKINVNEEGEVTILRKADSLEGLKAIDVVKAIGRGFSPEKAFRLKDDDVYFDVIPLKEFANTPKQMRRIKSRVIGEKGKVRENLELMTGANISVYGKTISLIGTYDEISLAKDAIMDIIDGKPINMVYKNISMKK